MLIKIRPLYRTFFIRKITIKEISLNITFLPPDSISFL